MTAINPYSSLPADRYWRRAVASIPPFALDPSRPADFMISLEDRVASAGSCFAQEVARVLRRAGCNFLATEDVPPGGDETHANFSAQFGNVYTTRQLVQLFARASGTFSPALEAWQGPDGRWVDPFRPRMVPGGFDTAGDVVAARDRHLAAVARMFEELDVFIFTFGLTEGWRHCRDGAALPLAPGVAGGEWDPGEFAFVNARVSDMVEDMLRVVDQLAAVNPGARVVLTVSPVPIVATLEDRHVLTSSTYTKSALRVGRRRGLRGEAERLLFPVLRDRDLSDQCGALLRAQHAGDQQGGPRSRHARIRPAPRGRAGT